MSDPTRAALEAALAADPDDAAGWHALADLLIERGDPRGEFMRVQLALDDDALPPAERAALRRREADLFAAHARALVGEPLFATLAVQPEWMRVALGPEHFGRGWLDTLSLRVLNEPVRAALIETPETRWLRHLSAEVLFDDDHDVSLDPLAAAAFVPQLRSFALGVGPENSETGAEGLAALLAGAARLETLTVHSSEADTAALFALPLPALRELSVTCCTAYDCAALAANPALANLRSIHFFPHALRPGDEPGYLTATDLREICFSPHLLALAHLTLLMCSAGDDGCRALAESGLLFRLETLDLSYGVVTDAGARVLADALRGNRHRLLRLTLDENCLTATGVAALRAAGIDVSAGNQHRPGSDQMFYHGDIE